MLTIGMMFLSSFLSVNLFVCTEAGITFTAHIVKFHPPFCCDPYCCNPPWQLKAVMGWFSVYWSQNVCQTFLTLHHSLGELHQSHSIFRLWENPMTHAPSMASPSVSLTAPLPNQAFPWPGWPHHLVVTGCLCHKGSRTLHKASGRRFGTYKQMCGIPFLIPNLVAFSCYTVNIHLEKWLMRCDTKRAIWWDLYNKYISIFCINHMSTIFRTLQVNEW